MPAACCCAVRGRRQPAQPPLVPLVQRGAGAAAAGDRGAGGGQAVLSAVADRAHKSTALPLALAYAALIVYASLYPFADWRDQGIAPWAYLAAPWPQVLDRLRLRRSTWRATCRSVSWPRWPCCAPAGRSRGGRGAARHAGRRRDRLRHGDAAKLPAGAHSLQRRPRPEQRWARWPGAVLAAALERFGAVAHWHRTRSQLVRRGFARRAGAAGAVAAGAAVSGGGDLRAGAGVRAGRGGDLPSGCSTRRSSTGCRCASSNCEPLVPGVELLCVMLGALVPCLLAFLVTRSVARRAVLLPLMLLARHGGHGAVGGAELRARRTPGPG